MWSTYASVGVGVGVSCRWRVRWRRAAARARCRSSSLRRWSCSKCSCRTPAASVSRPPPLLPLSRLLLCPAFSRLLLYTLFFASPLISDTPTTIRSIQSSLLVSSSTHSWVLVNGFDRNRFRLGSRSRAAIQADASSASGAAPVAERMSATRIAAQLVRERGLLGLYKGYTPTFLRDVGFSMLYFPLFAHLNRLVRCSPLLLYSSTLRNVYIFDRSRARTRLSNTES